MLKRLSAIISADQVKTFQPSPMVYALGPEILHLPAEEILFVSSNQQLSGSKQVRTRSGLWVMNPDRVQTANSDYQ